MELKLQHLSLAELLPNMYSISHSILSVYVCVRVYVFLKRTPTLFMLLKLESVLTHGACVTVASTLHASHTYHLGYKAPNLTRVLKKLAR